MKKLATIALVASLPLALAACELAPKTSEQTGFRGSGGNQIYVSEETGMPDVPPPPYELPEDTGGPRASEVYENVQVLGDISADEFNYLMAAITEWVAPDEGCNYCHNPANMASDEIYTKIVARRMIQMNQNINQEYGDHVGQTGVTCYTCHAGNNIPENVWTLPEDGGHPSIAGDLNGQNNPVIGTGYSSLPENAMAQYLLNGDSLDGIRVQSASMHPTDNPVTTMDAESTYSLMVHMSQALGVNCTYCHNTQSFGDWSISGPVRSTAWYGLRMVANSNEEYVTPLTEWFPDNRLGPAGDPYKINCTTCHQGLRRPLGGAQMAQDYPALWNYRESDGAIAPDMEPDEVEAP